MGATGEMRASSSCVGGRAVIVAESGGFFGVMAAFACLRHEELLKAKTQSNRFLPTVATLTFARGAHRDGMTKCSTEKNKLVLPCCCHLHGDVTCNS